MMTLFSLDFSQTPGLIRRSAVVALMLILVAALAESQTRSSAALNVRVLDASGAAVVGAKVQLRNEATSLFRQLQSDASGSAIFVGLPLTGSYELVVEKLGFSQAKKTGLQLNAGEQAGVELRLSPQGPLTKISVTGTAAGVSNDSSISDPVSRDFSLEELPVLSRKVTTLPLLNSAVRSARGTGDLYIGSTLFIINGSGRRQTTFAIDNATADDSWGRQTLFTSIPLTSIEEFSILTNAMSAENGRSTGSAVNVVTKSGTNAFHGEGIALWRPSSIGANIPFARFRAGDALQQGSGSISGPAVSGKTYFSLSGEYTHGLRDSVITSPLDYGDVYTGEATQSLMLARLDHNWSDRNRTTLRVNFDRLRDNNPQDAVGNTTLPTAGRVYERRTYAVYLSDSATLSDRAINEARFQLQVGSPITQFTPISPSLQFTRTGAYAGTSGESRYGRLLNHQYQWGDTLTWTRGKHSLRFGADAIYSSSGGFGQEFGSGYVLGQFTVNPATSKPFSDVTLADVTKFTQSFGNLAYNVKETLFTGFVQDNWQTTQNLTLNLGVRYDRQTLTDAGLNFAPRLGLAYRLPGDKATVLRASYGVFYSEIRSNLAAGYNLNGPEGIYSFSASPGEFGFPTSLAPLPAFPAGVVLPARDITVNVGDTKYLSKFFDVSKLRFYPDRLLNPYTHLWSTGVERELTPTLTLSVDYVGQHTLNIDRPVDLNAPSVFTRTSAGQTRSTSAANATRPITPVNNGYRRIIAYINQGQAGYNGLQTQLRKRLSRRLSGTISYTWSHTIGSVEPDTSSQDPNDSNLLGDPEKATSLLDQRHRLTVSGWYELPWKVSVGTWFTAAAGRPYNITTGVDNNGDGSTSDRPVTDGAVIGRNAGKGTPTYDVSMFVEKSIGLTERVRVTVRGEGFNLTNHLNVVGRNGVWGNGATAVSTFGTPASGMANIEPSREFEFQARIRF